MLMRLVVFFFLNFKLEITFFSLCRNKDEKPTESGSEGDWSQRKTCLPGSVLNKQMGSLGHSWRSALGSLSGSHCSHIQPMLTVAEVWGSW